MDHETSGASANLGHVGDAREPGSRKLPRDFVPATGRPAASASRVPAVPRNSTRRPSVRSRPVRVELPGLPPGDRSTLEAGGDEAWFTLDQVNRWIRFAEVKALVLLAASAVIAGVLLTSAVPDDGVAATAARDVLWDAGMVALGLASTLSLAALLPGRRAGRRAPVSVLHPHRIARRARDEYLAVLAQTLADPQAVLREVADQIWTGSILARRKLGQLTVATWLVAVGVACGAVTVYLDRLAQ